MTQRRTAPAPRNRPSHASCPFHAPPPSAAVACATHRPGRSRLRPSRPWWNMWYLASGWKTPLKNMCSSVGNMISNIWKNPPTPAFSKAGAAPGATGGVELALSRPWPSHCPRLPPSPVAVSFCCSSVATCRLRAPRLCPCCSSVAVCLHIASVVRAFKPVACQPSNF